MDYVNKQYYLSAVLLGYSIRLTLRSTGYNALEVRFRTGGQYLSSESEEYFLTLNMYSGSQRVGKSALPRMLVLESLGPTHAVRSPDDQNQRHAPPKERLD